MIFKASKRSGGRQLGSHLLKTEENEHVEIHEVSGFISDTVMGAMNEAYTLEAELGITPNGIAEPDFQGWEVKQYGVRDFVR
ncbi:MAG: hypothetical protein RLZZ08_1307, partial [Pseudomonadota bacterium]